MKGQYQVILLRPAEKDFRRLAPKILRQIHEKLLELASNPRPQDVKLLHGAEKAYRVDSGEYRILYEIDDAGKRVTVRAIKHRREAYRGL
ncbi:MAG TPA: type II toxin-antitoxin system RelE/ParE family toxin [Dehalococcoidia bacterium]|nr:type II toxin-antitoxin system RelE/ParE family toxin [Dehalococcoidia bacterium]